MLLNAVCIAETLFYYILRTVWTECFCVDISGSVRSTRTTGKHSISLFYRLHDEEGDNIIIIIKCTFI